MRFRLFLLLLLLSAANVSAAAPAISVRFTTRTVSASGFQPGSDVLVYGVGKIPLIYYSRFWRWQFVTAAQGADGTATIQSEIDIPLTSVWVVADLKTGQITVATPRPAGVRTVRVGRSTISGPGDTFSFDRSFLDLLYVYPGRGAWTWHARDGGQGDEDGANGLTTVHVSDGVSITGATSPKAFSPGGTLVAIDSSDLSVLTSDVQALLNGGQQ